MQVPVKLYFALSQVQHVQKLALNSPPFIHLTK